MLVNLRDTKRQQWTIELEPTDTVETLKTRNGIEKGYSVEEQKMIYSGKILQNNTTIESLNLKEDGFIICMVSKKHEAPTKTEDSSGVATSNINCTDSTNNPSTPTASDTQIINMPSSQSNDSSTEANILRIVDMGYPRAEVEAAMRAAFNNVERAVEYLVTGISDTLNSSISSQVNDSFAEAQNNINLPSDVPDTSALDFLRDNPQFQEMRRLVQQQPHLLEPLIQQLATFNPNLAQLISQNSRAFIHLLSEGAEDTNEGVVREGPTQVHVTPEENAAIERLSELGFDRNLVVQAYFACDKNEEVTANYLFEHGHDDEE